MDYIVYDNKGEILQVGSHPGNPAMLAFENFPRYIVHPAVDPQTYYIDLTEDPPVPVPFPEKPNNLFAWDWQTLSWVEPASAKESAATSKLEKLQVEFNTRTYAPVFFDDAPFDADLKARNRITPFLARLMRGFPLPPAWAGWRDYNNDYHWITSTAEEVFSQLSQLSMEIEDREQALLRAAWNHQANIQNLVMTGSLGDIQDYDITEGWNQN